MARAPRVLGLTLCRRITVDRVAVEVSWVGVFHSLHVDAWPAAEPFLALATILGGTGQGTIELTVIRAETEQPVHRYRRWLGLPGEGMVLSLELPVRRCVFPAPGRYVLTLRFDGQQIAQRPLDLFQRRPRP